MSSIFEDHIGDIDQEVSLEGSKPKASSEDKPKHNALESLRAHRLPAGIKLKVEKLIDLMVHKDPALKVEKVDYKIAKELFALIPEYVSNIDTARLTRNPSVANADLVRNALIKNAPILQEAVVAELYEHYSDLNSVYQRCKADVMYVMSSLATFTETVRPKLEKLTDGKTLVMIGKDTYDLRTADLETLKGLNLYSIDYEPLSKQLPELIHRLTTDDLPNLLRLVDPDNGYGKIYTHSNLNVLDIFKICGNIGNNTTRYTSDFNSLEATFELLSSAFIIKETDIPSYVLEKAYREYDVIVNVLVRFTKLKDNIDSDMSVLDAIDKLVDLLGAI